MTNTVIETMAQLSEFLATHGLGMTAIGHSGGFSVTLHATGRVYVGNGDDLARALINAISDYECRKNQP